MTDPSRDRWTATPKRVLLHEQLLAKTSPRLAACYWEAIKALREGDDIVRYGVAGHLLRELQSGLPNHLNVPEPKGGGLGQFFNWLRDEWQRLTAGRPAVVGNQLWTGIAIDSRLGRFLGALHEKIATYDAVMPRRRAMHLSALGALDPALGAAPSAVQVATVKVWMDLNDVFNSATHMSDPNEFEAAVEALEDFLTDRLAPKTFEKFDAIAALVKEAEGHAEA